MRPEISFVEAETGSECLSVLRSEKLELAFIADIFSDKIGMDILRMAQTNRDRRLIVLTADKLSKDLCERAKELGAYDCIAKPCSTDDIHRIMKRCDLNKDFYSALVLDHMQARRRNVLQMLSDLKFNISASEAENSPLALSLCRSIPYHFIFIDEKVHDENGLDVAIRIKRLQRRCRVILMVSERNEEETHKAKEAGLSGIIEKPFDAGDLSRILYRLLDLELPNLLHDERQINLPKHHPDAIMI